MAEYTLTICGIGPGNPDYVIPQVHVAVQTSDVIVGGKRQLAMFDCTGKITVEVKGHASEIVDMLGTYHHKNIAILVSGDTGFHSLLGTINRHFPSLNARVIPGISTSQYFFAALQRTYEDAFMGSLHGQDIDYIQKLDQYPAVFLLTDHKHTWKHVATKLCEHGRGHYIMHVGSNLSYPDQQIITATASELSEAECSLPLCSVIIDRPAPSDSQPGACLQRPASIADEQFTRGDVPMTKQDIRVLALSKLCLEADDHLLDVGAGTGSVSVEAAQVLTRGRVTAIERKPQAIELIEANARKFGVGNITIRQGSAPGQLEGLAGVTKVFVGGSGGELPAIMQWVAQNTAPGTRVVITAVTLNTLQLARECLDSCFFDTPEFTNVAITRVERMGTSDMLRAQTPVWIINTKRK